MTALSFFAIFFLPYALPDCVMVARQILVLLVGVRVLLGELIGLSEVSAFGQPFFSAARSLRLSVRTKDSQSLKTGSIPVGTEIDVKLFKICTCGSPARLLGGAYSFFPRKRRAFVTTNTELSDIAKLAIIGDKSTP